MENVLRIQSDQLGSLKRIEKLEETSKVLKIADLYQQRKIDDDGDRVEKQLINLNDQTKEHNSNVIKLFQDIDKSTKTFAKEIKTLSAISKEQAKEITDTSQGRREFRTLGVRVDDFKDQLKDFFSVRGFLDKTGIAERGSGGLVSEYLDRAEERKKYVDARMQVDPTKNLMGEDKARETFARQFDEQQVAQRAITKNEREIQKIADQGFRQDQIERSDVFKNRIGLATNLAKVDTRVRPEGFDPRTGMIKTKADGQTSSGKSESADSFASSSGEQPEMVLKTSLESLAFQEILTKNSMSLPQIARDINVARQNLQELVRVGGGDAKTGADAQFRKSSENESLMMVGKGDRVKRMKEEGTTGLSFATAKSVDDESEAAMEAARAQSEQLDILRQIEENTRGGGRGDASSVKVTDEGGLGDMLKGILGSAATMLKTGFMSALKFIFNPANILKFVSKVFLPVMIVGSVVNGIIDGFKAFFETGSITEALIAGLGGILEFLTFGLVNAESIKKLIDFVGTAVDEYIVQPLMSVFAPVVDFFKNIKDTLVNFVQNFGIPEFGFTIPLINKKVSIGPFYPFRSNDTMAEKAADSAPSKVAKVEGKNDGTKVTTYEDGGRKEEGAFGAKTYDKDGKLVSEKSPTFAGTSTEKFADGSQARYFQKDGMKYKEILDKDGKVIREAASVDLGLTTVNRESRGTDLRPGSKISAMGASPQTGNLVASQSAENDAAKQKAGGGGTTVVAPTTNVSNNSSSTFAVKAPVRNPDASFNRYANRAYA